MRSLKLFAAIIVVSGIGCRVSGIGSGLLSFDSPMSSFDSPMSSFDKLRMTNSRAFFSAPYSLFTRNPNAEPRNPSPETRNPSYDLTKDKVLYTVGYAHLDTQWRWTYQDSIRDFIPKTMRQNFALFEKYPDYVFNFTGSRRYQFMKEYYPADWARVRQYVKAGRWHVAGSSVDENDANNPSAESIIRQVLYGNEFFRKELGEISEDYMLPDCFGFPADLPSILAHCGVKGFSTQKLTWNSSNGIPFNVGFWEGPDGKGVVAALNPGGYGDSLDSDFSKRYYWEERLDRDHEKSGIFADCMYHGTGDTGGSPSDSSVKWVQASVHGDGPVHVLSAAADQMFKDITPDEAAKLQRYKGDLLLVEHSAGSLTSEAYMKRWTRKNELLADAAERASVAADWLGGAAYPRQKIWGAWNLVLGNEMHDILPGTATPQSYEFSWNDEVVAMNRFASVLQDGVGAVARALDTRGKGIPVVVFNPLSIEREDVVETTVDGARFKWGAQVYGPHGEYAVTQTERVGGKLKVVFLAKLPPVGFGVYVVCDAISARFNELPKATNHSIENDRFLVKLNDDGDVVSVYDKKAKREVLSAPIRLAMIHDTPSAWPAWNMDWKDISAEPYAYVGGPATIKVVEKGPVRATIEVDRQAEGSHFIQRISLAAGSNRLEFDNRVDWDTRKTALLAAFPLAAANKVATYNLGMGAVERPNDGPRKYQVPAREWVDLTDAGGGFGAAMLEDCKNGSGKPNDNTLRLTLIRTPGPAGYDDQTSQDIGRHEFKFALAPHEGDWRKEQTPWEGARLNQPLLAFLTTPHAGKLGKSFSLLRVSTPQVAAVALKKAEDSDEVIVRLQELYGRPANGVRVACAVPIASAREVDGQERELGPATVTDGKLVTSLTAFSPRAFALKLGSAPDHLSAPKSLPVSLPLDTACASKDGAASGGPAMPVELWPETLTDDGVTFRLGQEKTAVTCLRQTIPLPAGYTRAYILAAADGDTDAELSVGGKQATLHVQDWTGFVGQWDDRIMQGDNMVGLKPAFIKRAPIAWLGTHRHDKDGKNEPYVYCYAFKYILAVPKGAQELTLPDDPKVRVFAITLANDANADTFPAQPLYDTLDRTDFPALK